MYEKTASDMDTDENRTHKHHSRPLNEKRAETKLRILQQRPDFHNTPTPRMPEFNRTKKNLSTPNIKRYFKYRQFYLFNNIP